MRTLEAIAALVDGQLEGDPSTEVTGLAPLTTAGPGDVVFVKDARNLRALGARDVAAVLCRVGDDIGARAAIRVPNPRAAAAALQAHLAPLPRPEPGVHVSAAVDVTAHVDPAATIDPLAVVEAGAVIAAGAWVGPGAVVGAGATVGADTVLRARVVLYPGVSVGARCMLHAGVVIGGPGFGVEPTAAGPVAFPQRGTVTIGDDVRIGANSTVDRATFGTTTVGPGTQIDNLVQVGHNVTLEGANIICAQSGLGGGARLERGAVMGPQAALAPEASVGPGCVLGARASIPSHGRIEGPGQVFMGTPPVPLRAWQRFKARWRRQMTRLPGSARSGDARTD